MTASSPEELPQFTNRPPMPNANRDGPKRAVPTWSNTMSTPAPAVSSRAQAATSSVRLLSTWDAPNSSARWHFSSVPAVASTVAPAFTANWMAATDTPDPAAWIITVSPAVSPPTSNSPWAAVR